MRALPWILFSAWIACASADPGGADPADPGGADPADTARPILASCGGRGSAARSEPEYIAGRVALERSLFDGDMQHCRYALERACLDWESGRADAGRYAFELAFRFCDDKTAAERGLVASALAREDFGEAYAVFERHSSAGPGDSAALADFAPAVYAGLSLTRYAPRGPVSYRLPKGSLDPDKAYRLSALPGMGLLYAGEPRVAASHFFLSVGFAALAGFSAWRALEGPDRSSRWVAGMDFALITTLFFNRYYFGGMREAARVAREKNLHAGRVKVAALAAPLDPFASPMPVRP
ncbi:MAG: hypothetical protein JWP91_3403 [Fibrobacteres bacterium]|nr:hypothetical protein [Fibrobacterota bacterium]